MLFPVFFLLLMLIFDTDTDTARLDIFITLVPSDAALPLQIGRQLQLACNIYTDPAIDLSSSGWLYNDQPFYLFNNHKYVVYYTPAAGTVHELRSVLTINGVTFDDLGTYSCEARNSAGMYKQVNIQLGIESDNSTLTLENITRIPDDATTPFGDYETESTVSIKSSTAALLQYVYGLNMLTFVPMLAYIIDHLYEF